MTEHVSVTAVLYATQVRAHLRGYPDPLLVGANCLVCCRTIIAPCVAFGSDHLADAIERHARDCPGTPTRNTRNTRRGEGRAMVQG